MTYQEAMAEATARLETQEVPEAALQAKYLLWHITHMNGAAWLMRRGESISREELEQYEALVTRRCTREPLQQITGEQEFMGLPFLVTKDVLIPRQDTEHLVMLALERCKGARVLDMCTGSGCIAVSLAVLGAPAEVTAVDVSPAALRVAEENARRLEAKVHFVLSDMFENMAGQYDMIVSNPPYIPPEQLRELMPEVRNYEPHLALYGGEDGLDFYRILTKEAKRFLRSGEQAVSTGETGRGGYLMVEIGYDQGESVSALFREAGFTEVCVHKDYAGLDRVVTGHL